MLDTLTVETLLTLRKRSMPTVAFDSFPRYIDMFEDWLGLVDQQAQLVGPILEEICGKASGLRILDSTCGPGTHVIGLAKRGHQAVGTDISSEMIEFARKQAALKKLNIHFAIADMLNLSKHLHFRYDAAICLGNSIPAFTEECQMVKALAQVRGKLRPGAPLLVGIRNYERAVSSGKMIDGPYHFLNSGPPRSVHQTWEWIAGTRKYLCSVYVDYYHGPPTMPFKTIWKAVLPEELSAALIAAGFVDLRWKRLDHPRQAGNSVYNLGFDELLVAARTPA